MEEITTNFLTPHFTLDEMTVTETGLYNKPRTFAIANLKLLCKYVLEPTRLALQSPIKIDSGYRSDMVNAKVKGAKSSQHLIGSAADFRCKDMKVAFEYIRTHLKFDQLIWEYGTSDQPGWIHVSYSIFSNRMQVLRSKKILGLTVYKSI